MNTETPAPTSLETEPKLEWTLTLEQQEVLQRRAVEMVTTANQAQAKSVVFLDKSARPLSHIFEHVHQAIYPKQALPKFIFVNIGSEKVEILAAAVGGVDDNESFGEYIKSERDIARIYGQDSTSQLQQLFKNGRNERRLVVDDFRVTGLTGRLAHTILNKADPDNLYSTPFYFLDSPADQAKFPGKVGKTAFPWHGSQTGVIDGQSHSFISRVPTDPKILRESQLVLKELDKVVPGAVARFKKAA